MLYTTIQQGVLRGKSKCKKEPTHPEAFTPVPVILDPRFKVDPTAGPVSDKLYGGFIEHLGRCIYGGLVDNPAAPSPAELLISQEDGTERTKGRAPWRKDVQKVLASDGELEIPMMRWPGGNYVSNYHWQDGVGPQALRPARIELAWLGTPETNQFGTDEFIDMCRANGWEPYICLNMGSGTYEEALAWVEYCNGTGNTHWANLRRKNTGRDEPHNVKYWGLGNEMWGPWQVGNLGATAYATEARRWAHGLKLVDPTIKLVSCGETGWSDWDREILQALVPFIDLHSIHFYSMLGHSTDSDVAGYEYEKNVFGPAAAERAIEITKSLIDLANIDNTFRGIPARDVKIAFDEWNVWDTDKAPGEIGLEQIYDYTDMLGVVAWLNILVRHHKDVAVACLAQSVNVIAPLMTTPDGICRQTTFWPLKMFGKYMKNGHLITLPSMPDAYDGPSYPVFIQQTNLAPRYVDMVCMAAEEEGKTSIRLSVLNRHPTVDWPADIDFAAFKLDKVQVTEVYSDDLAATNTFAHPESVTPTTTEYTAAEWAARKHIVQKHSWQFIIFEGVKQ